MSTATAIATGTDSRRLLRSSAAIVIGFLSVAVLSLATDQVLHVLDVYPPWGEPMYDPGLNALALSYRILYTILGGYITARLAPRRPMRHVMVVGVLAWSPARPARLRRSASEGSAHIGTRSHSP